MKTKFYLLLVLVAGSAQLFAQCGQRYKDMIFPTVTKTSNVTYSTANGTTLKMDIYEPTGDTAAVRPLLIMAHGGSFIQGAKGADNVCVAICNNYAKRGYVTADIDYRLAADAFDMLDSSKAIEVVLKAISDGKSAIRFFRKDAYTSNTYRIDTNHIFAGGNSAGSVLFIHVMYLDSTEEAPPAFQTVINANGGFEGNSGNLGYSSKMHAVLNLAGGLNVPEFVGPGSGPSYNAQGTADNTVPYNCAYAQGGVTPVRLCGLGAIEPLYQQHSVAHVSELFPGKGHCPWASNQADLTRVDTTSRDFFYALLCGLAISTNDIKYESAVSLFPNPAANVLNLQTEAKTSAVSITDELGRTVLSRTGVEANYVSFDTHTLAKGIYFVKIDFADKNYATAVRKVIIE